MRTVTVAIGLALTACNISGAQFFSQGTDGGPHGQGPTDGAIHGNGSDGDPADGSVGAGHDAAGAHADAAHPDAYVAHPDAYVPPPPDANPYTSMTKGYIIDPVSGISQVMKYPAGGLVLLAGPTALGEPQASAVNPAGDHIYITDMSASASAIRTFSILSNGSLVGGAVTSLGCSPRYDAVSPNGKFLAVGCADGHVAVIPISSTGALGTPTITVGGTTLVKPAFSPNGSCLYFADPSGVQVRLWAYQFNSSTGALTYYNAYGGPVYTQDVVVHPNGHTLYIAGQNTVEAFSIASDCGLSPVQAAPAGLNTSKIVIDPSGTRLYATGTEVYGYTIASNGTLTQVAGDPYLSAGQTLCSVTLDPALPNILYITDPAIQAVVIAGVDANGAITEVGAIAAGSLPEWFQLAP